MTVDNEWADKRALILRCAAEVFTKVGYSRGTTKQVAKQAGLSQSSIYHYVGSKEEMLSEIAREVDRAFQSGLHDALAGAGTSVQKLSAALRIFTLNVIAYRNEWTVYWNEEESLPAELAAEIRESKKIWVDQYKQLVRQCQAEGALSAEVPASVVTEAVLGSIATINRWYRPGGGLSPDEIADSMLKVFGLPVTVSLP
jgi:TetR/AcrR family transcriptional regulator, cholesterol catabolism regulator